MCTRIHAVIFCLLAFVAVAEYNTCPPAFTDGLVHTRLTIAGVEVDDDVHDSVEFGLFSMHEDGRRYRLEEVMEASVEPSVYSMQVPTPVTRQRPQRDADGNVQMVPFRTMERQRRDLVVGTTTTFSLRVIPLHLPASATQQCYAISGINPKTREVEASKRCEQVITEPDEEIHQLSVFTSVSRDFILFSHTSSTDFHSFERESPVTATKKQLSVMSVNLWNHNEWATRVASLSHELQQASADVIGFQEVRSRVLLSRRQTKEHQFQVEDLHGLLPRHQFVSHKAMQFVEESQGPKHLVHEGLALFSRYPIVEWEALQLSRDPSDPGDFHQRIALRGLVEAPFGRVHVINTHLSLSEQARNRTLLELGSYAQQLHGPVVLMGDFNCELNEQLDGLEQFGLQDAWLSAHPHPDESGYTFHSWEPHKRIDYVLVKASHLAVDAFELAGAASRPAEGTEGVSVGGIHDLDGRMYPSDHYFPFVTLSKPQPLSPSATESVPSLHDEL